MADATTLDEPLLERTPLHRWPYSLLRTDLFATALLAAVATTVLSSATADARALLGYNSAPRDANGRYISQVLQEQAQRGVSIMLGGSSWEPQELEPASSSREPSKGWLHPADSVLVIIDMQVSASGLELSNPRF